MTRRLLARVLCSRRSLLAVGVPLLRRAGHRPQGQLESRGARRSGRRRSRPRRARSSKAATTRSTRSPTSSISQDPNVVALRGARGDRARPVQRGRSRAAAGRARARRRARPRSSSGCCCRCSAVRGARPRCRAWPRWPRRRSDAAELARAAPRAARARPVPGGQRRVPRRRGALAPDDPAINTAWGELFLEKYNKAEALKSFQAALEAIRAGRRRSSARARALADDNPPQARGAREAARSRSTRRRWTRTCSSPSQAVDAGQPRRGARARCRRRSRSTRRASSALRCSAALAYVEDKTPEFEAEVAKVLAISPELRRGVPRGRRAGRAQLPVRRGRRR